MTRTAAGAALDELLGTVDSLAARRPVAARVVAMTDDDGVGAKELADVLVADATLSARLMRLANSAYYGLGGRVRTVAFSVTVVGFTTVRTMAAVAAAGADDESVLPADFWTRSKTTAVACGELAGCFGLPTAESFCLGLLSSIGQAVLCQHDPEGYPELLALPEVADGGRAQLLAAEAERYGVRHTEVSAAALSAWTFPREMARALHEVDRDVPGASPWALCLRTGTAIAGGLLDAAAAPPSVVAVSAGAVPDERLAALLPRIRDGIADSQW
ncbi:HDOD domain-containing protein [Quadrisphaera sp. DSM 44207]|uniref:HDOD domain-containing protein n=1 Tax=Quadrisphaera sp. DSM 44207 TaxID=1881057 RepID=UPI00088B4C80|nr:HDOD domain-containing protein [Quadrisphaera sp. DSM 44207]SDQ46834.1 HD-like signal output (HDOD) domain, no enzymatic activity [Quadrisphaera sp. DSM 44207]